MTRKRPTVKILLIALSILCLMAIAGVLAVFKGGKLLAYFTPAPTVAVSEMNTEIMQWVKVFRPEGKPVGLAFLAADSGKTKERDALARTLAEANIVVAAFDFDAFRRHRAAAPATRECHYVSDDLKDAGQSILRQLQLKQYFPPVVIGIGDAASFAYAAVAQAPRNTLAGAISVGFTPALKSDRPYCPGAAMERLATPPSGAATDPMYAIGNDRELPAPWYVVTTTAGHERIDAFQSPLDNANTIIADSDKARRTAIVSAILEMQPSDGDDGLQDIPVSIIRPPQDAKALIVIISGDGGWRDIDKSIGERLAGKGIAVVGIDSLRYFWSRKEPAAIASDLELLLTEYGKVFKTETFALAGYSFGANVIPFAWPIIDKPIRRKIRLVSLLGLSPTSDFEISVEGYLGSSSAASEPVEPLLALLPAARVQCFYGEEETADNETACLFPELDKAERIKTEGGHHFGGEYDAIADRIASRLLARPEGAAGATPSP